MKIQWHHKQWPGIHSLKIHPSLKSKDSFDNELIVFLYTSKEEITTGIRLKENDFIAVTLLKHNKKQ